MEKRIFGIILTLLGIIGLVMSAIEWINMNGSAKDLRQLIVYGVLGIIFFFSGIGLIRNTRDVIKKDEHVS